MPNISKYYINNIEMEL